MLAVAGVAEVLLVDLSSTAAVAFELAVGRNQDSLAVEDIEPAAYTAD